LKEGCKLLELAFKIVEKQQQRHSSMASMGFWFAQKLEFILAIAASPTY
jgi:hypothetical protein